jgi:spermidine/putrescine-binding protein
MKKKNWNLSEKKTFVIDGEGKYNFDGFNVYQEKDIKEFIKRLKESYEDNGFEGDLLSILFYEIDSLAGSELTNGGSE